MALPTESAARKAVPMARGLLDYFPDALAAVAELSTLANEKHNPGEPLHWSKDKSSDHADCILRHMVDRGKWIEGEYARPVRHSAAVAWRALALLQTEIERSGEAGGGKELGETLDCRPGKVTAVEGDYPSRWLIKSLNFGDEWPTQSEYTEVEVLELCGRSHKPLRRIS